MDRRWKVTAGDFYQQFVTNLAKATREERMNRSHGTLPLDLRIHRLDPNAKLPTYGTDGATGLDLYALENVTLTPGSVHKVRTGIALEIPPGYEGQVRPRSELTSRGVFVDLGTIDSDYRGEVCVLMHAYPIDTCGLAVWPGHQQVKAGDRIAQLVIAPVPRWRVVEVDALSETARGDGGFGSTGR
jgi:dUTP pyrophosphatase